MHQNLPKEDEVKLLMRYKGPYGELLDFEKFMYMMALTPRIESKVNCLQFASAFEELLIAAKAAVQVVYENISKIT